MLGIHVQKGQPKPSKPVAQRLQPNHKKKLQNRPAKKYNKNWKQLPQFPIMAILAILAIMAIMAMEPALRRAEVAIPPITHLPNYPLTKSKQTQPQNQRRPGLGPPSK